MVLVDWCARDEIQHMHVHFGTNPATVALLAKVISNITYSLTVHGPDEFDHPEAIALPEKIEAASFVIAVSSYGRGQLMRWVGAEYWEKIHVVHCGVEPEFHPESPMKVLPEPSFVCVARLAEQKGHHVLLRAAAELQSEGVDLKIILAGDGPMRFSIEQQVEALGLSDKVTLLGWVSGERVREEIERCRMFVLPSFAEGLPVALMEAMALQRPVISTYTAGIPELVIPGLTGWLVPAGDIASLVKAMREALSTEQQQWMRMGDAARQRVLDRHNIANEARKIEILMQEAINTKPQVNEPLVKVVPNRVSNNL
jgi:glycosyltransferase involved in cell wall biosynthesis